ncbi:MAG: precorrin-4 C(11)-methyltransferase [Oscillospiraceae bacterium]|nr:precorrin-4 C(11)-methyltransferase [Oscillospiraceae bacterium]
MVNFVGAGCGAPDLITVRGARLLSEADVIIYAGSLINTELLKYAKKDCEMFDSAFLNLDEIIEIIKKAENNNKMTVRLQTGDTSIYSALREQTERLDELNIPYEICAGVSSFCGAAAALKAEYTLPDVTQTVIITRIAGRTAVPEKEKISSLAAHNATMIIFLSAGLINEVTAELLSGGYDKKTPAAIVYKATWSDEKIFRCTLEKLAETAEENGIKKTALICVGDFLGNDHSLSKLYDKEFETEYRKVQK